MNNSETKDVVIKHVGVDWVEYDHVSTIDTHFPNAKAGQVWRVTTEFSEFYRGFVITNAVLIKE